LRTAEPRAARPELGLLGLRPASGSPVFRRQEVDESKDGVSQQSFYSWADCPTWGQVHPNTHTMILPLLGVHFFAACPLSTAEQFQWKAKTLQSTQKIEALRILNWRLNHVESTRKGKRLQKTGHMWTQQGNWEHLRLPKLANTIWTYLTHGTWT
jgi:hypothetical protein